MLEYTPLLGLTHVDDIGLYFFPTRLYAQVYTHAVNTSVAHIRTIEDVLHLYTH